MGLFLFIFPTINSTDEKNNECMHAVNPISMAKPKGHYTPAMVHNGFVFVSGQISMDDEGNPVPGTIEAETRQCLKRIDTILKASGSNIKRVLKVNIFVSNINDWAKVNEVFADCFGDHRPARIVAPCGPLHYGCSIEMDCIAAVNE